MLLKVVTLTGEEKLINVEKSDKIVYLKEKLEEQEGIPPAQQRLIYQGKQLKDDRTVDSYKLKAGTVLHLVVALRDEIYQTWLQLRYDYLKLTPEIYNLLKKLRQYYFVGLITNGTSCAQWEKIDRLNLQNLFDIILVSGDLPWEKPHPRIFHEASDFLGVESQQCIMVGDKLETDILGGMKANLGGTVWMPLNNTVEYNHNNMIVSPDYVIGNIMELLNLLPKHSKESTAPRFVHKRSCNKKVVSSSLPDFDDSNSNSSDGS